MFERVLSSLYKNVLNMYSYEITYVEKVSSISLNNITCIFLYDVDAVLLCRTNVSDLKKKFNRTFYNPKHPIVF